MTDATRRRPRSRLRRLRGPAAVLVAALVPAAPAHALRVTTVATGLEIPWEIAVLPDHSALVTERPGRVVPDSGRIAFGPDRRLYISTGDAGEPLFAQDLRSLNGKLLALSPRQYRGSGPVRPAIVAVGLRNTQGFDWQPGTDRLVATDHGPSGFDGSEGWDEVNMLVPGHNYGWPSVFGRDQGSFDAPLRLYRDPVAPSGATFVSRGSWRGDFVFACLRGQELRRLTFRGGRVVADRAVLVGRYGRLRTVVEAPDGGLYVLTSNRDGRGTPRRGDDRILHVAP